MTYMSIVSFLSIALDNVGRFLAMLLLVLQLGAAGGAFPILLSSGFFQAVNPLMPMTYSIYGFREAISSGLGTNTYWSSLLILVAIGVVANLMLITAFRIHGNRRFQHESIDA
jgi:putative membrane protein